MTSSASTTMTYRVEASTGTDGISRALLKQETIDFDTSAGQSDIMPGPAELLLLSFVACVLKNVERFSEMLPFKYRGATISVVAERQDSPPRMTNIVMSS